MPFVDAVPRERDDAAGSGRELGDRRHDYARGLAIRSELDEATYPTGREVTDEEMDRLSIKRDGYHGEWNYSLLPRSA